VKALLAEDQDFLRPLVQTVLQELLEAEMTEAVGAEKWTTLRVPHKGQPPQPWSNLQKILDTTPSLPCCAYLEGRLPASTAGYEQDLWPWLPGQGLWDESCCEVQNWPHELLEHALETTIGPLVDDVVEAVPHPEAALLTIGAAWALDEHELELEGDLTVVPDLIRRNLREVVAELAAARDMSRFHPSGPC
jgi:hypothetical protein